MIVAFAGVPDVHVPPISPSEENVDEPPTHIFCIPDKVPAFGAAVTVTVLLEDEGTQPAPPTTV